MIENKGISTFEVSQQKTNPLVEDTFNHILGEISADGVLSKKTDELPVVTIDTPEITDIKTQLLAEGFKVVEHRNGTFTIGRRDANTIGQADILLDKPFSRGKKLTISPIQGKVGQWEIQNVGAYSLFRGSEEIIGEKPSTIHSSDVLLMKDSATSEKPKARLKFVMDGESIVVGIDS